MPPNEYDNKRITNFLEKAQQTIATHGWMVQAVSSNGISPSYAYSVGLSARLGYELACFGLPAVYAHHLLNEVIRRLETGLIPDGEDIAGIANMPLRLITVRAPDSSALNVALSLGYQPRHIRILRWPDEQGHFPGDPAYRHINTQSFKDIEEGTRQ